MTVSSAPNLRWHSDIKSHPLEGGQFEAGHVIRAREPVAANIVADGAALQNFHLNFTFSRLPFVGLVIDAVRSTS